MHVEYFAVYFKYSCRICNLNCILYTYFELCTFIIVSQNTFQKVNLMRSLMAD